jgi:hypothetical protein
VQQYRTMMSQLRVALKPEALGYIAYSFRIVK